VICRHVARQRPPTAVTRQQLVNSNRGTVLSVRSVPRCYKQNKLVSELVGELVS
jgi:hypothetical protein